MASPESELLSDWPRNKRYLKLSDVWLPLWQCDFRPKKSRELMNSKKASDETSRESEFLSALNGSLESFVHKNLKDEQIECSRRMIWEKCFRCATDGIRQERYICHISVNLFAAKFEAFSMINH